MSFDSASEPTDAERWDERYRDPKWLADLAPDPYVLARLHDIGPGSGRRALDLAAGTGRNALELARQGWDVEAWDVSQVGLDILQSKAQDRGVRVTCRRLDLTDPIESAAPFDLILVVSYLDRELFNGLRPLLRPRGLVLITTFTTDRVEGPSPRHCLHPGELRAGLAGYLTLHHEEAAGRAGLLAQVVEGAP